jgi:phage virion morphogenesis protein
MAGIVRHVTGTFDASPIQKHLQLLAERDMTSFTSVRREIGEYLLGEIHDNFKNQTLADGSPMPQSKAAQGRTTHWKRSNKKTGRVAGTVRAAGKTLIDTHRLYDSYVYQLVPAGLALGSALIYAAIHHFGGETGRTGHRFNMVARPVMGVGPKQERKIGDFLIAEIEAMQ